MTNSFKKIAATWSDVYALTQEYIAMIESQSEQVVRIYGYGSLIFNNANEKNGSELPNESAILKGAKVSLNLMAAGEAEYRGEYNRFTDERARRSTGVYMGMEQGNDDDFSQGLNVTLELSRAKKSLSDLYSRELGSMPEGITIDDIFAKDNSKKFENLTDEQNNLKLYKLAIVDTEIEVNGEVKKVPALAVPVNEKSVLAAVGKSALEIAVMVAQGQGAKRKKGDSTLGGDAIDYFINNHNNFKSNNIQVPFMDEVHKALKKYLSYSNDINDAIKSGNFTHEKIAEIYEKNGLAEYSKKTNGYDDSGLSSQFFNGSVTNQLTKRADITEDEYKQGLKNIPFTAKLSIERLADLYKTHFAEKHLS